MTERGREKMLEEALREIAHASYGKCPFDDKRFELDPKKPCPVCGDLGTFEEAAPSKCHQGGASARARAALASPSTQEPALRGGKVEEIAEEDFENRDPNERVSIPRGEILARDKALTAKDRLIKALEDQLAHANGVIMGQAVVLNEADRKLAALRTYAGESAAQSERAGLERNLRLATSARDYANDMLTAERQRRIQAENPRYIISDVEGRFYVTRLGTDTVVAEFEDHSAARYAHADDLSEEGKGG